MHSQRYASVAAILESLLQADLDVNVFKQCEADLIWRVELATLPDAPRKSVKAAEYALLIELHVCLSLEVGNHLNLNCLTYVIHAKLKFL